MSLRVERHFFWYDRLRLNFGFTLKTGTKTIFARVTGGGIEDDCPDPSDDWHQRDKNPTASFSYIMKTTDGDTNTGDEHDQRIDVIDDGSEYQQTDTTST